MVREWEGWNDPSVCLAVRLSGGEWAQQKAVQLLSGGGGRRYQSLSSLINRN